MKSNIAELRRMSDAELRKALDDLYQELFNLRFQKASGQVKDTSRFRQVRRQIARIKTLLRERELAYNDTPSRMPGEKGIRRDQASEATQRGGA